MPGNTNSNSVNWKEGWCFPTKMSTKNMEHFICWEKVLERVSQIALSKEVTERKVRFAWHVVRLKASWHAHTAMKWVSNTEWEKTRESNSNLESHFQKRFEIDGLVLDMHEYFCSRLRAMEKQDWLMCEIAVERLRTKVKTQQNCRAKVFLPIQYILRKGLCFSFFLKYPTGMSNGVRNMLGWSCDYNPHRQISGRVCSYICKISPLPPACLLPSAYLFLKKWSFVFSYKKIVQKMVSYFIAAFFRFLFPKNHVNSYCPSTRRFITLSA